MATVTFIRYARQSAGTLSGVSGYISQKGKTVWENGQQLVSGQNCTPQLAAQEFRATRDACRKDSPIWFYHYVQSFHPDEPVTGPEAHQAAKEFAERAWPDSEVLIATHIDADHVHTHFLVNAVCFQTGKMLRQRPNTLNRLRKLSDEICTQHHLSVLPPQPAAAHPGMTAREYRAAAKGQSWKFRLMNTIDQCMRCAGTKEEFTALMRSEGYGVRWTNDRKNITYTTPDGLRCRDDRLHQKKYLKEAMECEFRIREVLITGGVEAAEPAAGNTHTTGNTSYRAGVAGTAGGAVNDPEVPAGTVRTAGSTPRLGNTGAGGGDRPGTAVDPGAAGTGWEEERASLLSVPSPSADAGWTDGLLPDDAVGGIGSALVHLGKSMERAQSAPPVRDATTTHSHGDRKTLSREREKKIAAGHKEDDHEEYQGPTMSM